MEWRLLICASCIVAVGFIKFGICNENVIQANISQSEGDWQSAMQFCGSPLGSRNPLNTSSDITVNVSSSGDINRLSWIAAYAFYTPWIKMLGCVRVTGETLSSLAERQATLEQVNVFNCFQFCDGLTYFSLSHNGCYCLNNSFPSESTGRCYPQRCSGNNEDFCGENLTNNLISIMNYQLVTTEFGGVEECLASMYTGIFTEDSTSYYGFRAPVVLPCSTPGLGYTYRTRLAFPASHSFRLYTLPVDSWYEAVDNSYGNQFGLLEFVIFRFRLADLNQPIVGDRYWVGYLRRHKMEFGAAKPAGNDVHCVAGRVNILGQLVLSYRNCNESLPVLCEVQSTEVTTLSSSISSTYTHTAGSTSTITSIGNIIDNADVTSVSFDWFIIIAIFAIILVALIILGVCWIVLTLRKKRRAILNASQTDTIDSDGVYTEIGNVYNAFPEGDTISTLSDRPLYTEPISLPERKKKRSSRRKEEKGKKRSLPRVPVGDSPNGTIGASRLSDLPVRRKSDFNVIESVIQMYDEATPAVSQPKTSQNIPDVVPQHEYHILEKLKNSEKVKDEYEDVEKSNDNVYHVLEPNPSPGETFGNRHGSATMRVSNRIPLSKWVGGRAANYEPSRISRIIHSQEGNLQTVQEGFEVDLNKKRTAVSLRSKPRRATGSPRSSHSALKATVSAPQIKSRNSEHSKGQETSKQPAPVFDSSGYIAPFLTETKESDKRESLYDHTRRNRRSSRKSEQGYYDTLGSIRDYVETSTDDTENGLNK